MPAQELPTIRVLEFKTEYVKRGGEVVPVEMVKYAPIHAIMTNQIWERVVKLIPPELGFDNDDEGKKIAFMRHRWSMIEPAYNAWKSGEEIPVTGTALGAWAAITADQAKYLRNLGIKTVEEVAAMTDATVTKLPFPHARDLPKQAKAYLESRDKVEVVSRLTALEDANADLQAKYEAALELLEKQTQPKPSKEPSKAKEAA